MLLRSIKEKEMCREPGDAGPPAGEAVYRDTLWQPCLHKGGKYPK